MAQRLVHYRECDPHPRNRKPPKATHIDVPLSLGDNHVLIDCCDECFVRLEREVSAWLRLGREDESRKGIRRFTKETVEDGRRVAALRARQVQPTITTRVTGKPMHLSGKLPEGLPHEAADWIFDPHAIERMGERNVSAAAALKAACLPQIKQPTNSYASDGTFWYTHGDVRVVVDPVEQVIYTVARVDRAETGKAV